MVTLGSVGGNQDAMKLLQMNLGINEAGVEIAQARNDLMSEEMQQRQKFVDSMRALTAEIDVNKATQANIAMRSILGIAGGDEGDLVGGVRDAVSKMTELMSSDVTKAMVDAISKAFGMVTIQPYLSAISEEGADAAETSFIAGDVLSVMGGNPQLVAMLRGLQTLFAGGAAVDRVLAEIAPEGVPRDNNGASIDYSSFADSIRDSMQGLVINGSENFYNRLTNIFKPD